MKSVTANALAQINERLGTEPVIVVQIQWAQGVSRTYADKSLSPAIKGKLLDVSSIDSVLSLDNYETGTVAITLDDTDGEIKQFIDQVPVHKRPCSVYLYYPTLDFEDDKILLFKGEISSPFTWAESDRQVTFEVVTQIEAYEVGFSPEEGQLDFVSPQHIGKAWPLVFGDVKHVPAQQVYTGATAQLNDRLQIVDPMLYIKLREYERVYQEQMFMAKFWSNVRDGAHAITFPIAFIIQEYLRIIILERITLNIIDGVRIRLQKGKHDVKENPLDREAIFTVVAMEQQLDFFSNQSDVIARYKDTIHEWIDRANFAVGLAKKASQEQLKASNAMRDAMFGWLATMAEICRQAQNQTVTLSVSEETDFPDGTPVDVCIKNVKFRVQFNHSNHTMTILAGPLDQHKGLEVDTWQPDDASCSNIDAMDGLNLFWLKDTTPPNLEGMYLLVRRRGNQPGVRHIIRVEKQVGRKVYFELVAWDGQNTTGLPRGLDIDRVVTEIVDTPFVPGPLGNPVPADIYRGPMYALAWTRPESQLLLRLIAQIPGGPNSRELRNLARLVFQQRFDYLRGGLVIIDPTPRDVYTIIGSDIVEIEAASGVIPQKWLDDYDIPYEEVPDSNTYLADTGTTISQCGGGCEIWIANILPSTIKYVGAYRTTDEGRRVFAPVPSRYYKKKTVDLGGYTVEALVFPRPLENYAGENWESQIYVSLSSSVGPNVVDVIQWLLETYTDKEVNTTNFAAIKAKVDNYPVGFALLERPNVLEEVKRICWEARLAIFLKEDKYNLIYLSEEPSPVDTITLNDIALEQSLRIDHTGTENLMTRIIASFSEHYLPLQAEETLPRVILRNNINRYGLHSREELFHIYNIRQLVEKSATFWLIRYSNTWKSVSFTTFLNKVRLDNFDAVTFPGGYFANGDTLVLLERVTINPSDYTITFTAATGVRQGEMSQYPFYWPALKAPVSWIETGIGGFGPGPRVKGSINC